MSDHDTSFYESDELLAWLKRHLIEWAHNALTLHMMSVDGILAAVDEEGEYLGDMIPELAHAMIRAHLTASCDERGMGAVPPHGGGFRVIKYDGPGHVTLQADGRFDQGGGYIFPTRHEAELAGLMADEGSEEGV